MTRIEELRDAIVSRIATVSDIKVNLNYKPLTFQATPLVYTVFYRERVVQPDEYAGRNYMETTVYQFMSILAAGAQDNQQAEITLVDLMEAVRAAINGTPATQLGTLLHPDTKHVVLLERAEIKDSRAKVYTGARLISQVSDRAPRTFTGRL